jgi:hypothetical protein
MTFAPNNRWLLIAFALLVAMSSASARGEKKPSQLDTELLDVFVCKFDEPVDRNYDNWPDNWTRQHGDQFPNYVQTAIVDDDTVESGRCLAVQLEGASASISSPPILALPRFGYKLVLQLKAVRATHTLVDVRLEFKNSAGEVRQTEHKQVKFAKEQEWTQVEIGPHKPYAPDVDRAVIRIDTLRGERGDVHGEVRVADVWLARQPSMKLTTDSDFNVYSNPKDVEVTCKLSGINEKKPIIKFQLLDATQRKIGNQFSREVPAKLLVEKAVENSDIKYGLEAHRTGYEATTKWRPPITDYGFYQVRVEMWSSETNTSIDEEECTIAVVGKNLGESETGEFGWTLPDPRQTRLYEGQLFEVLEELLPLTGVNWVKLPAWFEPSDVAHADRLVRFADLLGAKNIEIVGIMLDPAAEPSPDAPVSEGWPIAGVFQGDAANWLAKYDHVMARLSLRIRWWQLGDDFDTSFVGYTDLAGRIADVQRRLFRFGQDVKLGLGWGWNQPASDELKSWEFEQLSAQPALTAAQLEERMASRTPGGRRWVLIDPSAKADDTAPELQYDDRVRELVLQMVTAKVSGAEGIFITNPFSGTTGVMNSDGAPGELLLPWRTTAQLLAGAVYLGELQLPQGSKNRVFRRPDGQVVMVIWSSAPGEELLTCGSSLEQINVWGKRKALKDRDAGVVIPVGNIPTFVVGLNEAITRWSMAVKFEEENLPSVFDVEHPLTLQLQNTFGQGVGGTVRLFVPDQIKLRQQGELEKTDSWEVTGLAEFRIKPHESHRSAFGVKLKNAAYGQQPVRIDFEVEADQPYRFSVWRNVAIGLGDISIKIDTELDSQGRLVVHQRMANQAAQPVNFECQLTNPLRRRKRMQVFELGAEGDKKTYMYSKGAELIGQEFTLKLLEINGSRVLIHRFVAER